MNTHQNPDPSKPSAPRQESFQDDTHSDRDREHPDATESVRPVAGSEVDDFAPGPRERGSDRGGFESDRGDANPGGTSGDSGQTPHRDKDNERHKPADMGDDEAPETPTDEPPPVSIQDPPLPIQNPPPLVA